MKVLSKKIGFEYLLRINDGIEPFPYLRSNDGDKEMWCVSPIHGRSFVVGKHEDGRYIVSKGNGLAYTRHTFLYTPEMPTDVWGLLLKKDAIRDFYCGRDVQTLGIKTNQMECVLELDIPIHIKHTNADIKPCLLQYSVECPYRIADAGFMDKSQIMKEVEKWQVYNTKGYNRNYLIAAEVLINNLRIMHSNGVLHNALTYENLTWALELLDFELTHTPLHPYDNEDYIRHVPTLFDREIMDTYKLIIYIAGVLHENVDYKMIDTMFLEYGFDIDKYTLRNNNQGVNIFNSQVQES